MKKYAYVIFIAVLFLVIFVVMKMSEPTPQQAVSFAKKQILDGATDPDAINFGNVGFFPIPEQKYGTLRGSVCGAFSDTPHTGDDTSVAEKRFISSIEVSNRGRSAKMSQPVVESQSNVGQIDTLWEAQCR